MVTRIFFLLCISTALVVAACGGGAGEPAAPSPVLARPTQAATTPSGPRIVVEPNSGPPGIEITVRGSGWEPGILVDLTGRLAPGTSADPYETVVSGADGSFVARFRLESMPDGGTLNTGRYDLIARSTSTEVAIPFLVETRRPLTGGGPGG